MNRFIINNQNATKRYILRKNFSTFYIILHGINVTNQQKTLKHFSMFFFWSKKYSQDKNMHTAMQAKFTTLYAARNSKLPIEQDYNNNKHTKDKDYCGLLQTGVAKSGGMGRYIPSNNLGVFPPIVWVWPTSAFPSPIIWLWCASERRLQLNELH